MQELMLLENLDEDYIKVVEKPKPKRKRRSTRSEFEPSTLTWLLALVGAGYFAWCAWKKNKTGQWTWTPWKQTVITRRLHPASVSSGNIQHRSVQVIPQGSQQETVSIIVP